MGRVGFIQDKLEIKFLILYVAARLIEPVPFEAMQELTMCDDGIDFFDFSECLSNLVESQHLTLSDDGLYAITEKGLHNGAICESSLPYSVRLRADKNITIFNQKLKRRAQTEIDLERRRAFDEVKGELSGIALDIASQVIEREVNEKDHEAFIDEFIKNVGEAS